MAPLTPRAVKAAMAGIGTNDLSFDDWKAYDAREREREAVVDALNKSALESGDIVGRTVRYPVADGCAVYVVVGATKRRVRLQHIGLWDGYRAAYLGDGGSFDRERIESYIGMGS